MPLKTPNKVRHRRSTILATDGGSFMMPGRFKVTVEVIGKEQAKNEMGSRVLAQYCQEEHLILLKRTRSKKHRKEDLEHELQHMAVDWIDHFVRKAKY